MATAQFLPSGRLLAADVLSDNSWKVIAGYRNRRSAVANPFVMSGLLKQIFHERWAYYCKHFGTNHPYFKNKVSQQEAASQDVSYCRTKMFLNDLPAEWVDLVNQMFDRNLRKP